MKRDELVDMILDSSLLEDNGKDIDEGVEELADAILAWHEKELIQQAIELKHFELKEIEKRLLPLRKVFLKNVGKGVPAPEYLLISEMWQAIKTVLGE